MSKRARSTSPHPRDAAIAGLDAIIRDSSGQGLYFGSDLPTKPSFVYDENASLEHNSRTAFANWMDDWDAASMQYENASDWTLREKAAIQAFIDSRAAGPKHTLPVVLVDDQKEHEEEVEEHFQAFFHFMHSVFDLAVKAGYVNGDEDDCWNLEEMETGAPSTKYEFLIYCTNK
tara:strand:- start:289 stop:810 length:522 start_codon:yes stop_codon:yes gene_type:complete